MDMTRGKGIALALAVILGGLGTVAYLWAKGTFDQNLPEATEHVSGVHDTRMAEALRLIKEARDQFANVKDYRCTYLREEVLDGKLHSNHVVLMIRHEPFSVSMEWVAPSSKKGRRTVFVAGKNNGKMLVKQMFVRMEL